MVFQWNRLCQAAMIVGTLVDPMAALLNAKMERSFSDVELQFRKEE
jgi:hypothetical protein